MKFLLYLKDKTFTMLISFMVLVLITLILIFIGLGNFFTILIDIILIIGFMLCITNDYFKRKKFYEQFHELLNNLDKKYLIHEIVKKNDFNEGNLIIDYLYDIDKSFYEELNKYRYSLQEFKEYLELWCHEIKTPIATSKLITINNKNKITESINDELNKIENYVEQVMYFARSENVNEDYFVEKINLRDTLNNVIKNNKKSLITKKIRVEMFKNEVIVESDSKWLEFIINQIIANSIKYSKDSDCLIEIKVTERENNTVLTIKDNGIGINKGDIENVFKKGFTGVNGRKKYNSTGMGLYLCDKLCKKLGHKIMIESEEGKETTIMIVFPINSMTR